MEGKEMEEKEDEVLEDGEAIGSLFFFLFFFFETKTRRNQF